MLDPKYLRNNLEEVAKRLAARGFQLDVNTIRELEAKRKFVQDVVQALQHKRNMNSKAVGHAKANPNEIIGFDLMSMKEINVELARADRELTLIQNELSEIVSRIPNIPHSTVPFGLSEESNQEIRRVGEPKAFSFSPKDHVELGARNDMMDFTLATKITGARFVVLQRELARLHRALIQFMLDVHTNVHGYQEVYVPYMVNKESLFGTGQLPKLIDDLFAINGDQHYFLIPTAEVPVTNLVRDTIIAAEKLPLKYTCHTPCFRSEAGSYGKDTRGMIRQHQFEKVEILQIVQPEDSYKVHEEITSHAEAILKKLDLPYRVVALCGGDLGFSSAKTYDLEVWLPGQQKYREISSCSNFEDFQARRMQARWRDPKTNKPELVHTLNGSGLAIGRTLVAIMENFQDEGGKIYIPEVLWPYTGGMKSI